MTHRKPFWLWFAWLTWTALLWGVVGALQWMWYETVKASPHIEGVPDLTFFSKKDIPLLLLIIVVYFLGLGKVWLTWDEHKKP